MASGSLPPGFPATEIEGEFFSDSGLVTNTPLQWVLDYSPRQDTLVFQLDLWNARGEPPRNMIEAELRQKEIRFSSRTRAATDQFKQRQMVRRTVAGLLEKLPEDLRQTPEAERLAELADEKVYNLIQLVYRAKNYEGNSKDYEFSRRTMEEHGVRGTTMRSARFAIRRCCNVPAEWTGSSPSILPNKIEVDRSRMILHGAVQQNSSIVRNFKPS